MQINVVKVILHILNINTPSFS